MAEGYPLDPERAFINKWNMHKLLQAERDLPFFLPETLLFSRDSFSILLNKYKDIYIKSVSSWGGSKVGRIVCGESSFSLSIQGDTPRIKENIEELYDDLASYYKEELCLVQQTAPLLSCRGRPFDIRTHLQKDLEEGWLYAGDLVRIGGQGSIVSNVAISSGEVKPTEEILTELLQGKTSLIQQRLLASSLQVCGILDKYHSFLDIGIDFGIDADGSLWLIEVNTDDLYGGPAQQLFAMLPDQSLYLGILKNSERISRQAATLLFREYQKYVKEMNDPN
ncbi:YheC/YheD family protein [Peribacillus kribbensis]|uniref:YheC/YheD family protein n=1 Tax=Peribacillus kribbensis TaxID=356658 RepID=UPI0004036A57|nr:YheC/YheD family protein [Peribacillus kribbensis]